MSSTYNSYCRSDYPPSFLLPNGSAVCASYYAIIIPIAVSNIIFLALNILWNHFKVQQWIQRFNPFSCSQSEHNKHENPKKHKWRPWAGLFSVAFSIAQAAASAALIRAGGNKADFSDIMLLWLVRPRMLWWSITLFVIAGDTYRGAGVDQFWADSILSILGLPYLVQRLIRTGIRPTCNSLQYPGSVIYLVTGVIYLFVLVAFLLKRRLHRGWGVGAGLLALTQFVGSWLFWAGFARSSPFCLTNLASIAAIHAIFPFFSATGRGWFS